MNLPKWETCKEKIECGLANPLEEFIYEYEPAGNGDDKVFREKLLAALRFLDNIL